MGHAVRGGEEHHITGAQGGDIRHAEREFGVVAAQIGVHLVDAQAGLGTGSDHGHLCLRVLRQQTQQFDTGVARAADDTDLDHHMPLCKSHWKVADDKAASAKLQPQR